MDDGALARTLLDTLSPDAPTRARATATLESQSHVHGYALALARAALDGEATETHGRQLAAVLLKRHVRERWTSDDGAPGAMGASEREEVKRMLPMGLSDPSSKMRSAFAAAIAQVCANEGGAWEALAERLVEGVRSKRSKEEVLGCLKCYEYIGGEIDAKDVAMFGPRLFPELLALARDAEDRAVRRRASGAFTSTLHMLTSLSGEEQRAMRDMMVPYLPVWLETVSLELESVPNPNAFDECASTLEALKGLSLAVQYFTKSAGETLMPALSRGAMMFHTIAPIWAAYSEEQEHVDLGNESDGDTVSFDAVITELLELVIQIAEQPKLNKLLEANLLDTIYITIGYMTMSTQQEAEWTDDPNQFIADEEEDFSNVRAACGLMLDSLSNRFGPKCVGALASAAEKRMVESISARQSGDAKWWRAREATLLAVGTLNDAIVASAQKARETGKPAPLDVAAFVKAVIDTDFHESTALSAPFLRGRALWMCARLSSAVPPAMAETVLSCSVSSMAPDLPPPLRIGACRAMAEFLPLAKREVMAPYVGEIYKGLGGLLVEAGEETIHLILEAMHVLIKADAEAAAAWLGALTPAVVKIWGEYVRDPLISADACEVFEALAAIPACQPQLHATLVPTLSHILASPSEQPDMLVEATLDLLTIILRPAGLAEAKATHNACFKYVCGLIMHSDDAGVMQGAAETLRAFLRAGKESMLEWGTGNENVGGGDVLRAMFEAASRLLDPTLEDSASLTAAPLMCQMLRRLPTKVGPVLRDITAAVVARLRSSKQPNLSASLLTVFARIAHFDANAFIELLSSLPSGGEEPNAFDFVMRQWVENQGMVYGSFDIKLTTSALGIILSTQHAALSAVIVKGQIVEHPSESGRIRTRQRARDVGPEEWTRVPLSSKIVEVLADALIELEESANEDLGFEDEEWEEDDDAFDAFDDAGEFARDEGFTSGDLFERLLMAKGLANFDPDDDDEAEDPVNDIDLRAFILDGLRSLHASGALVPLAQNVGARQQRAMHEALSK
ncbi:Armadillo-type fold [Ostreococcus tauri]|uniref:Armadillo-type fold n=2 Tax=Ostreococcus tauri TaxID=70448 RepID=A0A090MEK1_OSTTA|nr:Armadillo-type fold [Ostreococcus tauri]CEG01392.1 Armadillo-type fold [Ostreococcus tauri]|eukprot:XP_022840930.1 Armadillo-type fold [Ostreococcus tauri]